MAVSLLDGRFTELPEVRDPITPASVSGPRPAVGNLAVISGAQHPAMSVRLSSTTLCNIVHIE